MTARPAAPCSARARGVRARGVRARGVRARGVRIGWVSAALVAAALLAVFAGMTVTAPPAAAVASSRSAAAPLPTPPTAALPTLAAQPSQPQSAATTPGEGEGAGLFAPLDDPDAHGVRLLNYDFMAQGSGRLDIGGQTDFKIGSWAWRANVYVIGFSEWLLRTALDFGLAASLTTPARTVAANYQHNVVARFALIALVYGLAALVSGVRIARGAVAKGLTEYLITAVIGALGATVLLSPATTLLGDHGPLTVARDAGTTAAAIAYSGSEPAAEQSADAVGSATGEQLADKVVAQLGDSFVRMPHQLVNFGTVLDGGPCASAYQKVAAGGPWGTDDKPRDTIRGCGSIGKAAAAYNEDKVLVQDRSSAAIFTLVASVIVAFFVVVMSIGLLLVQLTMAVVAITGVFALPLGIVPGAGRAVLARWFGFLLASVMAVVATLTVFGLFLLGIQVLAGNALGLPLLMRFLTMIVVTIGAIMARKRVLAAAQKWSHAASEKLHHSLAALGGGGSSRVPGAGLAGARLAVPAAAIAGSAATAVRDRTRARTDRPATGAQPPTGAGSGQDSGAPLPGPGSRSSGAWRTHSPGTVRSAGATDTVSPERAAAARSALLGPQTVEPRRRTAKWAAKQLATAGVVAASGGTGAAAKAATAARTAGKAKQRTAAAHRAGQWYAQHRADTRADNDSGTDRDRTGVPETRTAAEVRADRRAAAQRAAEIAAHTRRPGPDGDSPR